MNTVRNIVHSSLRGYRTFRGRRRSSAWDSPPEETTMQPDVFTEPDDPENEEYDMDAYESDFSGLGDFDRMHEKELVVEKLKVKNQIVKRKYFQNPEPATLTWGEKEQIRLLHAKDPEEWSPEMLSQCFPASREAVTKVLRSTWTPRSPKTIELYEKRVKENWELFRAGKLTIDPKLHAHLSNFKNREIKTTDPETMKKFVKPKPVFPKPKSNMFSNVIEAYTNSSNAKKNCDGEKTKARSTGEITQQITSGLENNEQTRPHHEPLRNPSEPQASMTYGMFLKKHVEGVDKNHMTPVDRVIVNEHKKREAEAYKSDSLVLVSPSALGNDRVGKASIAENNENESVAKVPTETWKPIEYAAIDENSLETGIIAREKKAEITSENYPNFIKISKKQYKRGATYKVEDRYYDDDGEFLYRVPGLLS